MPNDGLPLQTPCGQWRFGLEACSLAAGIFPAGGNFQLLGNVRNLGDRVGSVYVTAKIRHLLETGVAFYSHTDKWNRRRESLHLIDIPIGAAWQFVIDWTIPRNLKPGFYDVIIELHNPHALFDGPHPHRFHTCAAGPVEIVESRNCADPQVFISYTVHAGGEHTRWVMCLAHEIAAEFENVTIDRTDLDAGDPIDAFIEHGIGKQKMVIAVCSKTYVSRFDAAVGGVGQEAAGIARRMVSDKEFRVIPIVRDNSIPPVLPKALANLAAIDMEGDNWRAAPVSRLLAVLRNA